MGLGPLYLSLCMRAARLSMPVQRPAIALRRRRLQPDGPPRVPLSRPSGTRGGQQLRAIVSRGQPHVLQNERNKQEFPTLRCR